MLGIRLSAIGWWICVHTVFSMHICPTAFISLSTHLLQKKLGISVIVNPHVGDSGHKRDVESFGEIQHCHNLLLLSQFTLLMESYKGFSLFPSMLGRGRKTQNRNTCRIWWQQWDPALTKESQGSL